MSYFEFPHTRTYDTDLGWVIKNVNTLDDVIKALNEWIATTQPTIDELLALYQEIINGNFPPAMIEAINDWMEVNAIDLVGKLVHMVFFGINDDGYFVAYIPESWEDIIFNTTGLDLIIPGMEYGHLVLSY